MTVVFDGFTSIFWYELGHSDLSIDQNVAGVNFDICS